MSDLKISQMPDASTLTGAELVPLVQSLSNVKATLDVILAWIQQYTVKAAPGDTTPDVLSDKIVAGSGISLTVLAPTGDSSLSVGCTLTPDHKVLVDSSDTTAAYLAGKIVAGSGISLTVLSPAGDESVSVTCTGGGVTVGGPIGGGTPNSVVLGDASADVITSAMGISELLIGQASGPPLVVSLSGDVQLSPAGLVTVIQLQGVPVAAGTPGTFTLLRYSGGTWSAGNLTVGDYIAGGAPYSVLAQDSTPLLYNIGNPVKADQYLANSGGVATPAFTDLVLTPGATSIAGGASAALAVDSGGLLDLIAPAADGTYATGAALTGGGSPGSITITSGIVTGITAAT